MTEVAQLSGDLKISLKTSLVLCMRCCVAPYLLLHWFGWTCYTLCSLKQRFVGINVSQVHSLLSASSQKICPLRLHYRLSLWLWCTLQQDSSSNVVSGWMNMHAYTHFWLSTCLWGMTALQIACFLRLPGFRAASSSAASELNCSSERRPCNFSEEVSCLVTLSVMESSSFHYPRF